MSWTRQVTTNIRRNFITGLLVVTPSVVAAWVLYRLFVFVDGLLWERVRFGWLREGGIPGVGAVTVLALVLLVGIMVNNYLGSRFYGFWESLAVRIPLFNKIYVAVKQIGEALFSSERNVFRAVGLIEYPRREVWCLAFITGQPPQEIAGLTGRKLRSVFVPTTPNPTSGFWLMLPEEDIKPVPISVEEGLKMVISGGAYVSPAVTPAPEEPEPRAPEPPAS